MRRIQIKLMIGSSLPVDATQRVTFLEGASRTRGWARARRGPEGAHIANAIHGVSG